MTTDAGNSEAAAKGPAAAAAHKDTDYSFEPVPVTARKGILPLVFVMTGFTFTSSAMSVGAKMGTLADFPSFAIALFLGGLFLSVYTGSLAYISCRTGMSFDLLAPAFLWHAGIPSSFPGNSHDSDGLVWGLHRHVRSPGIRISGMLSLHRRSRIRGLHDADRLYRL